MLPFAPELALGGVDRHRVAPVLFVFVRPYPVDTRAAPPVGAGQCPALYLIFAAYWVRKIKSSILFSLTAFFAHTKYKRKYRRSRYLQKMLKM